MAAMRTALLIAICLGLFGVAKAQEVNVTVIFYEDDNQSGVSEAFPVLVGSECTPCQTNPRVAPAPEGMDDDDDAGAPTSDGDDSDDDDSPPSPPSSDSDDSDDDDSSPSPPSSDSDDSDDDDSSPPSPPSSDSDDSDDDDSMMMASPPSGSDDDDDDDNDNEFESYSLMLPEGTNPTGNYSLIVYDSSTCSGRNATLTMMQADIPDELEDDVDSWRVCPPGVSP